MSQSDSDSSDEDYLPGKETDDDSNDECEDENSKSENDTEEKRKAVDQSEIIPKKSADELWNEFISDTKSCSTTRAIYDNTKIELKTDVLCTTVKEVTSEAEATQNKKEIRESVMVEEILEFCGERVGIDDSVENNQPKFDTTKEPAASARNNLSLSISVPTGINNVLDAIGKKRKIGTLEKSKLDWENFKRKENLEEQLKQHNRGRHGYLDKQEFLMQVDHKQFERERDLRNVSRKKT